MVEGNGPGQALLVFPVTRTGDLSGASSARFTMTYDTATYDVDVGYPFSPTEDTPDHVHLAPGVATAQVRAVVRPDTEVEPDETVTLTLSEPVNAALVDAVATGTVLDDDQARAAAGASWGRPRPAQRRGPVARCRDRQRHREPARPWRSGRRGGGRRGSRCG